MTVKERMGFSYLFRNLLSIPIDYRSVYEQVNVKFFSDRFNFI